MQQSATNTARPDATSLEARIQGWVQHPALLLTVFVVPLALQIAPWWNPAPDAASYLSIARRLAHGESPRLFGTTLLRGAIGYPILAAPAFWIGPRPFWFLFLQNWIFGVLTAAGVYLWARRAFPVAAPFVAGLTIWNVTTWHLTGEPLSELAFAALLVWTALAFRRLLDARGARQLVEWTVLAALLLMAVSTVRQVGLLVVGGYAAAALLRAVRRQGGWRRAVGTTLATGLPATTLVVGLLAYYRHLARGAVDASTYVDQIHSASVSWVQQLVEGVRLRTAEIGRLLVPGMYKAYARPGQWLDVTTLFYVVCAAFVLWAWWKLVRRDPDVLVLTFPFYLGLYVVWPFDQGTRFMMPMLPVLWLSVWMLIEPWHRHRLRLLGVLLVLHLAVAVGYLMPEMSQRRQQAGTLAALDRLGTLTSADAEQTATFGTSAGTSILLAFVLDRPIRRLEAGSAVPRVVRWLVTQNPTVTPTGFRVIRQQGQLSLLQREVVPRPSPGVEARPEIAR